MTRDGLAGSTATMKGTLTIDGSHGEGGGQILRSALGLSLVTGRPFRIEKIRAKRSKPGLLRQHLTAVRAAAEIGAAEVTGATLGSLDLTFRPTRLQPGDYSFAIGTAGSATLVLQAVLPGLLVADGPSRIALSGGTHNPAAPPFDFLARAFLPLVERMGATVRATLVRPGFFPAGGGEMVVEVEPGRLTPIDLVERGEVVRRCARAIVANLPFAIAKREVATVGEMLGWDDDELRAETVGDSHGPGNVVLVEVASERVTELFVGFGQRGVPAERVAAGAAHEATRYLEAGVAVGEHLADQLLVPFALAGGGAFTTLPLSMHARTNAEVIEMFLGTRFEVEETGADAVLVTVKDNSRG